jgi:dipeptidase D
MTQTIKELFPQTVWKHFSDLCAIPRPSKNEGKAAEFVKDFAIAQGLDYTVDATGNVIIRKPASPGMEGRAGVVLQAHLDMVPQKNSDVQHDFEKDPIQAYVDNDWVRAKGTTLGADNGIGVAAALAVLESKDVVHGPLEALFTIDEETGMTGANGLEAGMLKGSVFIYLDSEEEGELYIGCAGGINAVSLLPYASEAAPADVSAFELRLTGLKGGHSGLDINLGRGNANKLMNRFLWHAARTFDLRVSAITGGNMRNAIPREAFATVTVTSAKADGFRKYAAQFQSVVAAELAGVESELSFTAHTVDCPTTVMTKASQDRLLNLVYAIPSGAVRMIADKPDVVETSNNLSIVKSDGKQVEITCLLRSSVDSAKDDLASAVVATCELAGATIELSGSYPGWKPDFDSAILKTMKDVYQKMYGKPAVVKVIHAGLECGIFGRNYPDMDYISFGPTIEHPHSPGERVNIPSVGKFWEFLVETLKAV